jgi:hypothetical protein
MKFFGFFLFFSLSCTQKHDKILIPVQHKILPVALKLNYDSCKKQVQAVKKQYKKNWPHMAITYKESVFVNTVTQTIMPNWLGTNWNFYGTTETPQKGSIACGYFVTTVLRDAGMDILRTKLAQCASEKMIRALVQSKYVYRFNNVPLPGFINAVRKQGNGLYIIGLDCHTGFIHNDGKEIYFIHASYRGLKKVVKEKASESTILAASQYKVIGKLSSDEKVLERWVN